MNNSTELKVTWIKTGGICGVASIVTYLLAAFAPLPDTLSYAAAFAFGPLVAIGAWGLYHGLALHRDSPLPQIATMFAIAGGVTVLLMLTTQQSIFGVMAAAMEKSNEPATKAAYEQIEHGLNSIHWGLDVAWHVLISVAVILFGVSMLKHPRFGKIFGALGIILGSLLLGFNLYHFPTPPASVDSIDWGPFVALWMAAAFVLLLRATAWAREQAR